MSHIVLFSLLQEGWSRAKKKVLGWPAEKLVQITGVKLWYGDSNLNPEKMDKCALCGCPLPTQPGGDAEPYSNSHWCRCKTNRTLSFFFPSIDGTSYYIELKLPQIWSSKLSCLPATSHWLPPHFLSWEN